MAKCNITVNEQQNDSVVGNKEKLNQAFDEFFKQIGFSLKDDLSEMQRMWMNLRAEELKNEILYYIIENGKRKTF